MLPCIYLPCHVALKKLSGYVRVAVAMLLYTKCIVVIERKCCSHRCARMQVAISIKFAYSLHAQM